MIKNHNSHKHMDSIGFAAIFLFTMCILLDNPIC